MKDYSDLYEDDEEYSSSYGLEDWQQDYDRSFFGVPVRDERRLLGVNEDEDDD